MLKVRKGGCVYIMSAPDKNALYTGVTSELENRVLKHREKIYANSHSARYNCTMLVYFKFFESIEEAIAEEKRLKGGGRQQKLTLIENMNPKWIDLWNELDDHKW